MKLSLKFKNGGFFTFATGQDCALEDARVESDALMAARIAVDRLGLELTDTTVAAKVIIGVTDTYVKVMGRRVSARQQVLFADHARAHIVAFLCAYKRK